MIYILMYIILYKCDTYSFGKKEKYNMFLPLNTNNETQEVIGHELTLVAPEECYFYCVKYPYLKLTSAMLCVGESKHPRPT